MFLKSKRHYNERRAPTSADTPSIASAKSPKGGGHAARISRLLKLLSPFGRKAVDAGIIKTDFSIASDLQGKKGAIINIWKNTFKNKPIDETIARELLPSTPFQSTYPIHTPGEADYAA